MIEPIVIHAVWISIIVLAVGFYHWGYTRGYQEGLRKQISVKNAVMFLDIPK